MSTDPLHQAMSVEMDNLRGTRFCEVVLLTKDDQGVTEVRYGSLGLSETFTNEQWDSLDPAGLVASFGCDAAFMNGPRVALMDSAVGDVLDGARVTTFGDIPTYCWSIGRGAVSIVEMKLPTYTERLVPRAIEWGFRAGSDVYELIDPRDYVYVLQSSSQRVDRNLTIEQLPDLGSRLRLPPGWRYRVQTLQQDLSGLPFLKDSSIAPGRTTSSKAGLAPSHATKHARVVWDEFENSYQRVAAHSAENA
jgi:hypothetical protein